MVHINMEDKDKKLMENCKFSINEIVLCYEPDPIKAKMLYDAKVLDADITKDEKSRKVFEYYIHFQGWNKSWDRWVLENQVLKASETNRALQTKLYNEAIKQKKRKPKSSRHESGDENDDKSVTSTGSLNSDDIKVNQRPLVSLDIPKVLAVRLEDDCYNIKRKKTLIHLPRKPSVNDLFNDYFTHCEKMHNRQTNLNIVYEVVQGLNTYFNYYLFTLLLYNFEREQYNSFFSEQVLEPPSHDVCLESSRDACLESSRDACHMSPISFSHSDSPAPAHAAVITDSSPSISRTSSFCEDGVNNYVSAPLLKEVLKTKSHRKRRPMSVDVDETPNQCSSAKRSRNASSSLASPNGSPIRLKAECANKVSIRETRSARKIEKEVYPKEEKAIKPMEILEENIIDMARTTTRSKRYAPKDDAWESPKETRKETKESPKETRKETKETSKETRKEMRDTPKETCKETKDIPRETRRESKDTPKETRKESKDTPKETRKETKDTPRETRKETKDTPRETRKETKDTPRETRKETRDTPRETRKETKEASKETRKETKDISKETKETLKETLKGTLREMKETKEVEKQKNSSKEKEKKVSKEEHDDDEETDEDTKVDRCLEKTKSEGKKESKSDTKVDSCLEKTKSEGKKESKSDTIVDSFLEKAKSEGKKESKSDTKVDSCLEKTKSEGKKENRFDKVDSFLEKAKSEGKKESKSDTKVDSCLEKTKSEVKKENKSDTKVDSYLENTKSEVKKENRFDKVDSCLEKAKSEGKKESRTTNESEDKKEEKRNVEKQLNEDNEIADNDSGSENIKSEEKKQGYFANENEDEKNEKYNDVERKVENKILDDTKVDGCLENAKTEQKIEGENESEDNNKENNEMLDDTLENNANRLRRSVRSQKSTVSESDEHEVLPMGSTAKSLQASYKGSLHVKTLGRQKDTHLGDYKSFMVFPLLPNGDTPADIYGFEHLLRLFVKLPILLSSSNIDESKVVVIMKSVRHFLEYLCKRSDLFVDFTTIYSESII